MFIRKARANNETRIITVEKNVMKNSYGSVLVSFGETKVLCTATFEDKTPPFINEELSGWLTAEYNMLPGSTLTRKARSINKPDGRNIEIQRLIARSLRAGINIKKIKGYTIYIDCDVIQADGGTRTASITGGTIALGLAVKKMLDEKLIPDDPITAKIAAISAGIIDKEVLLDLNYSEDSIASVDFNVVMNDKNRLIEVQGCGEKSDYSREDLSNILDYCEQGITMLFKVQEDALKN